MLCLRTPNIKHGAALVGGVKGERLRKKLVYSDSHSTVSRKTLETSPCISMMAVVRKHRTPRDWVWSPARNLTDGMFQILTYFQGHLWVLLCRLGHSPITLRRGCQGMCPCSCAPFSEEATWPPWLVPACFLFSLHLHCRSAWQIPGTILFNMKLSLTLV